MTNQLPRVSVVTPSYNAMPYIRETIESILAQEYPDVEHIIMDGGSKDGTVELLKNYPGIKWRSEKDKGQSDALNKAFAEATGDIIGWLNADDTYCPGAMHAAIDYLQKNPEVDMVFTDLNIIDEQSENIGMTRGRAFDPVTLLTFNPIKQPTMFMRRKILDKLKGVDEQYHYVMDREFWMRIGMEGYRVTYLPGKIWANFRMCKGTKSFEDTPEFRDEWLKVMNTAFAHPFFKDLPLSVKNRAISANRFGYHLAKMIEAANSGNRSAVIRNYFKATGYQPGHAFKPGMLNFLLRGLLGLKIDKLKKFNKRKQDA